MPNIPRFSFFLFLILIAVPSLAQKIEPCEVILQGRVIDEKNQPLPFAKVEIQELGLGTMTDAEGNYRFTDLCPGTYTLRCDHIHCGHQEHQHVLGHEGGEYVFHLESQPLELETVHILADDIRVAGNTVNETLEGAALMEGQGQGIAMSLKSIPGVSVIQTGQRVAKPVIQGLHSNRVLILNNGIRLEGQQWGADHAPEIDPYLATRLTVVKGAAGVRYGAGAMGGVILVRPAIMPDTGRISGQIHMEGQSNGRAGIVSGILQGVIPRHRAWAWRVQGTRKRAGSLHTPDYFLENTAVSEFNFSGTLRFRQKNRGWEFFASRFATDIGIFAPSHLGGRSDVEAAIARPQPLGSDTLGFRYEIGRPSQSVRHHLTKWEAYQYMPNGDKFTATYAFQFNRRLEFDAHNPRGISNADAPVPELDFRIFTHTLESSWKPELSGGWQVETGIMGMYQNNWLEGRPFIPNFAALTGGVFGMAQKRMGNWQWEAGARFDYWWMLAKRRESINVVSSIHQFQSPSLTLGGIWRQGAWKIHTHLGSAWRPPHVNELFSDGLHHGSATVEEGNPDLTPEQSIKWQNSFEWQPNRQWRTQLSAFSQYFQNFIFAQPGGFERTIRGTFPLLTYTQARAWLAGVDATVNWRSPSGLGMTAKGAWLRTHNLDANEPLIFMPANWVEGELGYFVPKDENSYIKIGYRRVAEQTQIPISPEGAGTGDWAPPPPGYGLLHVAAAWTFHLEHKHLQLGLRADNLMNVRYRDYLNRFRYFADEPGRNWTLYARLTF